MPAALLLVLAFRIRMPANRLAEWHAGWLERERDVIPSPELRDDDLNVLLSSAGDQEFFGLRIPPESHGRIGLEDAMNGDANAILVGASLGLDGERQ
jgi:hypothetical protein